MVLFYLVAIFIYSCFFKSKLCFCVSKTCVFFFVNQLSSDLGISNNFQVIFLLFKLDSV